MDHSRIGPPQGYLPIEEHGIVGDLRTVALIGTDGTVDWYCPSRFDAPSLFGALLDARKGGYFSLTSRTGYARPKQLYLPDTNILLTRFQGKEAVGEVIDFMVPETRSTGRARDLLVRQCLAVRGRATFELACHPAFDYGRASHEVQIVGGVGAVFTSAAGRAVLRTNVAAQGGGERRRRLVHPRRGRERHLPPGVERRGPPDRRRRDAGAVHDDPGLLAELGRAVALHRPLAGDGAALGARAQAAGLPPDRRAGGGADHVAAGGAGRLAGTGTTATPGSAMRRSPSTR